MEDSPEVEKAALGYKLYEFCSTFPIPALILS